MSDSPDSTQLPNVNAVGLAELLGEDESAFAHAVRRLANEVGKKADPLAAFTSYVEK